MARPAKTGRSKGRRQPLPSRFPRPAEKHILIFPVSFFPPILLLAVLCADKPKLCKQHSFCGGIKIFIFKSAQRCIRKPYGHLKRRGKLFLGVCHSVFGRGPQIFTASSALIAPLSTRSQICSAVIFFIRYNSCQMFMLRHLPS